MCLYANKKNPKKGKHRISFDKDGFATCWKSYDYHHNVEFPYRNGLYSIIYDYGHKNILPGDIISNREEIIAGQDPRDDTNRNEIEINRGIHVFTRKKTVEEHSKGYNQDRIVKVRCHKSDLVAVDKEIPNAVFMKVLLSKKEYDKAMKE